MAVNFSNPRIDGLPAENTGSLSFADDFTTLATIAANNGTNTGCTADHGLVCDGASYVTYDVITQPDDFSVVVEFSTTTTALADAILVDNSDLITDDGFAIWLDADGVKANFRGSVSPENEVGVDLTYNDGLKHTITYIVEQGQTHSLYVDALDVDTELFGTQEPVGSTNPIVIGGDAANYYTGTITKVRIYNSLLVEADHDVYYAGTQTSFMDSPWAVWRCDTIGDSEPGTAISLIDGDLSVDGYGAEELTDGDMEDVGTASYTSTNAVLSKRTTAPAPYEGLQWMKIVDNGASARATHNPVTVGVSYRCTGAANGDATASPQLYDGNSGILLWGGTSSTSWQAYDFAYVATKVDLWLWVINGGIGDFVGFDGMSLRPIVNPYWTVDAATTFAYKVTTTPYKTNTQALRIKNTSATGYAKISPDPLTVGVYYKLKTPMRSDGTATMKIVNGSVDIWTDASASATWVENEITFQATDTDLLFYKNSAGGEYVDLGNVELREVPATAVYKILDRTINGRDITKGSTPPTFTPDTTDDLKSYYEFNGIDDFITFPTLPSTYTNIVIVKDGSNFTTDFIANDTTYIDILEGAGTLTGRLYNGAVHSPVITSPLQLSHLAYQHMYWINNGRCKGAFIRLITTGDTALSIFLDGTDDPLLNFVDEVTGTDTLVTANGLAGATFASSNSNVEYSDASDYECVNCSIFVSGTFAGAGTGTVVDKGANYKLIMTATTLDFNGSTISHASSSDSSIGVVCKTGAKPRFFASGRYIGDGSATVTPDDSDSNDLIVGNNNEKNSPTPHNIKHVGVYTVALADKEMLALHEESIQINSVAD